MQRKRLGTFLFIAAGLLAVAACQDQRGLPKEALDWSDTRPVSDPYEMLHVAVEDDSLVVHVTYSGGCAEHQFKLQVNGPQLRSLPPKQPLALVHQANGDACRASIEETLSFDLRPYRMSPSGITVLLFNDTTLMYRYE